MSAVHVYAPPSLAVRAFDDQRCWVRARDGRVCGGRWFLVRFYEWHDPTGTCCACGARITAGEYHGRHPDPAAVREEFMRVRDTQGDPRAPLPLPSRARPSKGEGAGGG